MRLQPPVQVLEQLRPRLRMVRPRDARGARQRGRLGLAVASGSVAFRQGDRRRRLWRVDLRVLGRGRRGHALAPAGRQGRGAAQQALRQPAAAPAARHQVASLDHPGGEGKMFAFRLRSALGSFPPGHVGLVAIGHHRSSARHDNIPPLPHENRVGCVGPTTGPLISSPQGSCLS